MRHPDLTRWHYTIGSYLPQIIESGVILPATAGVPKHERPAVWFTVATDWEETANKLVELPDGQIRNGTRDSTARMGGGLVRIGVAPETVPHDWSAWKQTSGAKPKEVQALYAASIAAGSRPGDWFISYEAVPSSLWVAVERFDADTAKWVAVDLDKFTPETSSSKDDFGFLLRQFLRDRPDCTTMVEFDPVLGPCLQSEAIPPFGLWAEINGYAKNSFAKSLDLQQGIRDHFASAPTPTDLMRLADDGNPHVET
jgi:hypothetical protein